MRKILECAVAATLIVIAVSISMVAYQQWRGHRAPEFSTPFQVVALSNGQVFFGRLEGLNSDYPVLRDVFYIQARQNPDTKQVANVLIKRGNEAHAPDRMIINRKHIILVEPVGENSQIAKLIADQSKGP
jgi:hypothetical protein